MKHYDPKFDNLDKVNQFHERYNLPKLIQREMDNLSRTTSARKIESTINELLKQKVLGPNGFTGEFFKIFRKKMLPTLHNLLQRIEAEGIFPKPFYETSITLKSTNRKSNVSHEHRCKNPQQNHSISNATMYKKN